MKFSTLIAVIGTTAAISLDAAKEHKATGEKCRYKFEADACTKLDDSKQPFDCLDAGDAHMFHTSGDTKCTW